MSRKPWVIALIVVLALAAIVTAGFIGFRIGLARGAFGASEGAPMMPFQWPHAMDMDNEHETMMFHDQECAMFQKYSHGMYPGRGTIGSQGYVPPILRFFHLVFMAVVLWLLFKFISKSFQGGGWQLTFKREPEKISSSEKESHEK